MKGIFHVGENLSMASMLTAVLSECERALSAGETKWCVGSVEDIINFVISVLGRNVAVQTMIDFLKHYSIWILRKVFESNE
ncbi:hypothetical protein RHMOL_Rhmol06G0311100 [Rhododendron molle]|uniref:Uncharacterized protein n=1 Tax=Rhododendron molle TaxID=49168 RepID=A0ACC0NKH6_RHOML|nr:hypothetical protein RHMOL_Rhmol06G0311100 [Rhododendron molle]